MVTQEWFSCSGHDRKAAEYNNAKVIETVARSFVVKLPKDDTIGQFLDVI